MRDVEDILTERGESYGDYVDVSSLAIQLQELIFLISRGRFKPYQRFAIQHICGKISRLANGDVNHLDSWQDIAGYATLVAKELAEGK